MADEGSIRNPDAWRVFFADRRAWAGSEDDDHDVVEAMYRTLYDYTVRVQLALHRATD